jgi:hypothetical protein
VAARARALRQDLPPPRKHSSSEFVRGGELQPPATRAASVLQASGVRGDATVFRLTASVAGYSARSLHLGGIRQNASTQPRRLITRRSQVQILPPQLTMALVTGPSCSQVGGVAAQRSSARPWNLTIP